MTSLLKNLGWLKYSWKRCWWYKLTQIPCQRALRASRHSSDKSPPSAGSSFSKGHLLELRVLWKRENSNQKGDTDTEFPWIWVLFPFLRVSSNGKCTPNKLVATIFGGFRRVEVPVLRTEYSLISENQPLLLVVIIEAGIGVWFVFFSFEALYNVIEFVKAFFLISEGFQILIQKHARRHAVDVFTE